MLIIVIFINGCSSSKDEEDKARTKAAERGAQQAAEEAKRHNLPICQGKQECVKGGVNCKKNKPATEPGVCWNSPTLTCICPPKTVCLMDTVTNPWPPIISSGHCKS